MPPIKSSLANFFFHCPKCIYAQHWNVSLDFNSVHGFYSLLSQQCGQLSSTIFGIRVTFFLFCFYRINNKISFEMWKFFLVSLSKRKQKNLLMNERRPKLIFFLLSCQQYISGCV